MNKLIFLDIDGVICTMRSHLVHYGRGGLWTDWDELACKFLHDLCEKYEVKIVISSTWRKFRVPELKELLIKHNLIKYLLYYSASKEDIYDSFTPEVGMRGDEINKFILDNPNVKDWDYRIIDDDADMLPSQMGKLIRTHCHNGITGPNMLDLLNWCDGNDVKGDQEKLDEGIKSLIEVALNE